jgi:hypothetical protein
MQKQINIFLNFEYINRIKIKDEVSHVVGADHQEDFFNKLTKLSFADSVVSVLVDLVQNVVYFFSCGVIHSYLLSDLDENLLELSSLEITTPINIDFSECVLH